MSIVIDHLSRYVQKAQGGQIVSLWRTIAPEELWKAPMEGCLRSRLYFYGMVQQLDFLGNTSTYCIIIRIEMKPGE